MEGTAVDEVGFCETDVKPSVCGEVTLVIRGKANVMERGPSAIGIVVAVTE